MHGIQGGKTYAEHDGECETDPAQCKLVVLVPLLAAASIKYPCGVADHERHEVGEKTEQKEKHIGEPRARDAADIRDARARAATRPAGVGRREGRERDQEIDGDSAEEDQSALAKTTTNLTD